MAEVETTEERSALMKRVRREDTAPEKAVRSLLWSTGARYRTNVSDLPGTPDIANKTRKKAVFVHGCFWHFHEECERGKIPKSNSSFWEEKFEANRSRDRRKRASLSGEGYDVMEVWECELEDPGSVRERLEKFWYEEDADD